MAGYNRTRYVEQLLENTELLPPSFTVHLHPEYWVLNNGSKFLYHNQIASLLDDIRAQRIPVDFLELFDSARVPFYDGCMVVELLDYRPQRSKEPTLKVPEKTRVVLHPNSETLWADICLMNRQNGSQWTDRDALEVEAKILLATSQPLCLDPDPHLTRIVNSVLRMSTPTMPPSLKRKAAAMEPEEDGPEKARRDRLLSFMAPQNNKSHMRSYRILETLSAFRLKGGEAGPGNTSVAGHQYMNGVPRPPQSTPQLYSQPRPSTPTSAPVTVQGASPMDVEKTSKKADAAPSAGFNVLIAHPNGSSTPLPQQPTHQFVNQHPPSNQPVPIGMQPQVYPSVQAATEAAKKTASPAQHLQMQQHYMQQQHQQQQQSHPQNQLPSQSQHPPQLSHTQQQSQQRFTQSPKLPAQPNATTPAPTQPPSQSFPAVQSAFQPPISHSHFLQQPPPGGRNAPGLQPTNQQHQQAPYAQSLHHQHLSQQLQQNANSIFVHQQRMAMAANIQRNATGGRVTPQSVPIQVSAQQPQHPGQATTPSPVKNSSPSVAHQQLTAAQAVRSSPMSAKAQLQAQPQQQHQLSAPQMQMQSHPSRVAFTPQYNSSQLRSLHGNPQSGHMVAPNQGVSTNSPTILDQTMAASPQASAPVSGRPITPAASIASGDGKQQSGQVQGQMQGLLQQPSRRQTPQQQLQSQLAAARAASQSQSPHTPQAQVQQQTPQLTNRTPQLQQRTPQQQFQQIQNHQSSPQAQAQSQAQQQQMSGPHYTQMYGYPPMNFQMSGPFWQRNMQGMMPTSASTPQQLLLMQQAQQQHQHQQQQAQQQQAQSQVQQQQVGVVGGQPIIMNSQQQLQQQPHGSIPIMSSSQQTMLAYEQKVKVAAQHQQAAQQMTMSKMPGQGGKGKVGQKKTVPKRGGGAGR